MSKVRRIQGSIALTDGTTREFSIGPDGGWSQWGGDGRPGEFVDALDALVQGLLEDDLLGSDEEELRDE